MSQDGAISVKKSELVGSTALWRDYLELCKPKVVFLILITSIVGMCLAIDGWVPLEVFFYGNLGIVMAAASAAVINHIVDQHIDRLMKRTQRRPIVQGKVKTLHALIFAGVLCVSSMIMLLVKINGLTALLTFLSFFIYAGIYTGYLKHATSQNIVIGGIAGAAPPLLGWVAVTNSIAIPPLLLLSIIFIWTPPHFWALAIHRVKDYENAGVPMLPCTHGIPHTKLNILLYTIVLSVLTLLPYFIGMSGWVYEGCALVLDGRFLYLVIRLYRSNDITLPYRVFKYSIVYLMYLFLALLLDHYLLLV